MTRVLYDFGIALYGLAIRCAQPFSSKAKDWVKGRLAWRENLKRAVPSDGARVLWFHAASLGEFEQGRPLIEACRSAYPKDFILLTFFSPSGYNQKKSFEAANHVSYLPLDTPRAARDFIEIVQPALALFVKYDVWHHFLNELSKKSIPSTLVSARFYEGQVYFKPWAKFFRKTLGLFTEIYVQDQASQERLAEIDRNDAIIAGDTRFDRVLDLLKAEVDLPRIKRFKADSKLFVLGSAWPRDMEVLGPLLASLPNGWKVLIAPHEIHVDKIDAEIVESAMPAAKWSDDSLDLLDYQVLYLDTIGLLSKSYSYADMVYVGGGFGAGVHNVLEPAVWGAPVLTGPNVKGVVEVQGLADRGGLLVTSSAEELKTAVLAWLNDDAFRLQAGDACSEFCTRGNGATAVIMEGIRSLLKN